MTESIRLARSSYGMLADIGHGWQPISNCSGQYQVGNDHITLNGRVCRNGLTLVMKTGEVGTITANGASWHMLPLEEVDAYIPSA